MPESARSSPLFPLRTPDPASTHPALPHPPDPRYPGLQATPGRFMHQSRNVSACPAPLMTHRHIYFAGTLDPSQGHVNEGGAAEEEVPLGSEAYLAAVRSEAAKISFSVRDVQVSYPVAW